MLRRHSVVVYVNIKSASDYEMLSPVVAGACYQKSMGPTIPKAVVCSPDQTEIYAKMSYAKLKVSKEYSKTSKVVKAILKGGDVPNDPTIIPRWYLKNSRQSYTGCFVKLEGGDTLFFKDKNGNEQSVDFGKLSAGSKACAERLEQKRVGGAVKKSEQPKAKAMEVWESAKGQKINAVFLALDEGKISLQKKNGKTVKFSLELLSEKSQHRAKELAEELAEKLTEKR